MPPPPPQKAAAAAEHAAPPVKKAAARARKTPAPARKAAGGPPPSLPGDDAGLVKAHIADYDAATGRLRDVAKWITTSCVGLGALLIGTSPLSGVAGIGFNADLLPPLLFGTLGLAGLGVLVLKTTDVLAPPVTTLDDVEAATDLSGFRAQVAKDPQTYLGSWGKDVGEYAARRDLEATTLANIDTLLGDLSTSVADRAVLQRNRTVVLANIQRAGWVGERLLAAAGYARLWAAFRRVRVWALACTLAVVVGVAGFLTAVGAATAADSVDGPVPVRVALSADGRTDLGQVLGSGCPTDGFEAVVLSGDRAGPWKLQVTDPSCERGMVTLTADQAVVIFTAPAAPSTAASSVAP